jgi:hypothetical protein
MVVAAAALLILPRRWAPLPLLAGACYMTLGQAIEVGPFRFTIIRILLAAGFIRVLCRTERPAGGWSNMDWCLVLWGLWAIISSAVHQKPGETLVFHLGMVYNTLGVYFLIRCFCRDETEAIGLIKFVAILLVPVALEMLYEQVAARNLFAILGGVDAVPTVRNGRIRSQGPFAHAILAGTVGAVCAPLMIGIWRKNPWLAKVGLGACFVVIIASASSGPLISVMAGAFALLLWRWRHLTKQMRIAAIVGYILLDLVMKAPAYYLIARIDLTGGSTGYHRAALIESSIEHLNEWWFAGTDYTRHWMPYGVGWSEDHADITNHYLAQGVRGGLPLMFLFMLFLWCGFRYVGQTLRLRATAPTEDQFLVWGMGAALFAHAATCTSVAYFDQSIVFLYLNLAMIASMRTTASAEALAQEELAQPEDARSPVPKDAIPA